MKKLFFIACISLVSLFSLKAQEQVNSSTASVEKSIFGVQTGFLGVWGNYELGLSNSISLRTEVGLDIYFDEGLLFDQDNLTFGLTPVITLEPRWYYNLQKRLQKNKNITKNSGNFLSLETSYNPNLFTVFTIGEEVEIRDQLTIIPTWGIRRTYWDHFTLEAATGLGLMHIFETKDNRIRLEAENIIALKLYFRLGYTF
ncbi:hypothetical protein [Mesonia aquimarina]|uniref:hypothetical protein n=1 Tax=Mesonia aquimarina TaxID=1504967 RepID=UPI000EF566E2|nr:hypothetical protein [Mesonia aquimarina]